MFGYNELPEVGIINYEHLINIYPIYIKSILGNNSSPKQIEKCINIIRSLYDLGIRTEKYICKKNSPIILNSPDIKLIFPGFTMYKIKQNLRLSYVSHYFFRYKIISEFINSISNNNIDCNTADFEPMIIIPNLIIHQLDYKNIDDENVIEI